MHRGAGGGAVDVADLGQAPARRMGPALLLAQGGLQLLPVGLGGGQAVIAVTDGQYHRLLPFGSGPAAGKGGRVGQRRQRGINLGNERGVLDGPAAQMPAAQHQLTVVERRQLVLHQSDGLDQRAVGVVGQHHDVGRFQRRPAADLEARRDALHDGALARADSGLGALRVVVGIKIDSADKALPDRAVHLGTLNINVAMYFPGQNGLAVLLHRAADTL